MRKRSSPLCNKWKTSIYLLILQAEKDPQFVANAYKRTQPVTIFQDTNEEEEDVEEAEKGPVYKAAKLG
jgi:hypothetical protein